jgi:hypothetical protein
MFRSASLAITMGAFACGPAVYAQSTLTWTSHDVNVDPSDNTTWDNTANWSGGVVPVDGDILRFPSLASGGSRAMNNNLSNLVVGGLEIPANAYTIAGNGFNLNGNVNFTAGGNSTFDINVPVTLQQDVTIVNEKTTSSTPLFSFGANVSGPFGITIDAATTGGRTQFNSNVSYTGDTTVTNGNLYLRLGVPYSGVTPGNLTVNASGSVLSNNLSFAIGGLNGPGGVTKAGNNTRTMTIGGNNADATHSGTISWTGGSSSITKTGTGTQTLSGPVSVSGNGVLSGGRLNVNDTWSTGMGVSAAGTLGGTGTLTGGVTGAGTVSPGIAASIGTLTVGSGTLSGTLQIDLDGTGSGSSDLLAVTGALDIGSATVNFSEISPVDDQAYVFASYGSLVGPFATITNIPANYTIDYAYQGNSIALTVVPEPATLAGLSAFLGFVAFAWKRNRRR